MVSYIYEIRSFLFICFCVSRFWPNNKSRMYLLENTGEHLAACKD